MKAIPNRWERHYNEFRSKSVDRDETDLLYQYLDDDRFILHVDDVYLDVTALLSECYFVSKDEYGKSNLAPANYFEKKIKNLPSKIHEVLCRRKVAFGPLMALGHVRNWLQWTSNCLMNIKIPPCVQSHFEQARPTVKGLCVRSLNALQPISLRNMSKRSMQSTAHPVSWLTNQGATPTGWLSTTRSCTSSPRNIQEVYQVWNKRCREPLIAVTNPNWIRAVVSGK